jgi:ABC-2 type transport system ATP-binding protein
MNRQPIVSIQALNKRFDGFAALSNVALEIYPGSITGLVGTNGSGKSTLLRHIIGMYLPSEGSCLTFGTEARLLDAPQLSRIGYVHQEGKLLQWMRVQELIRYVASHYPSWDREMEDGYVARFELDREAVVGLLSPGKRQQLAILLAIGFKPELLILDEPAAALDPIARADFLNLLLDFISDGKRSIVISSHILSDIEKIIDRVVIMEQGSMLRNCGFDELQEEFVRIQVSAMNGALPAALPFRDVLSCERDARQALLVLKNPGSELDALCAQYGLVAQVLPLSFEDVYRLVLECARNDSRNAP